MPEQNAPLVFVSYAHESDATRKQVTELVADLRSHGVDAHFDRDVNGTPSEGWPAWMERQLAQADFVLVICSPAYLRRYNDREAPGIGKGAIWEGAIIRQQMYESAGNNTKFAAVLFDREHEAHKPAPLRPHTHYIYPAARIDLLRWLTRQASYTPPPLGTIPHLPPDP
jgi:hypothetical protein